MKNTDVGARVIDTDYRGNVRVLTLNHSAETFNIEAEDRIAQFVLTRYITPDLVEVSDLEQTICTSNGSRQPIEFNSRFNLRQPSARY